MKIHSFSTQRFTTRVKRLSPQNPFGVSGVNSVAAKSKTIEINGDHFFKRENRTTEEIHNRPPYCSCGVIQVSVSPTFKLDSELRRLHRVFSLNVLCDPPPVPAWITLSLSG